MLKSSSIAFSLLCLVTLSFSWSSSADAGVVFSNEPFEWEVLAETTFNTDLRISSWDNAIGAFSLRLNYDPGVVRIQEVQPGPNGRFADNTFWDVSSFESGETTIVAFQTENSSTHPASEILTIQWLVVGTSGNLSELSTAIDATIDESWRPIEIVSWPANIIVGTDADDDGMADGWEGLFSGCLSPTMNDGDNDCDGDGLTNLQEYLNHTDPTNPDTDGDGMPDGWEAIYGFGPLNTDAMGDNFQNTSDGIPDGQNDYDGDGYSNYLEYLGGTDPTDELSMPSTIAQPFSLITTPTTSVNAISLALEGTGLLTADDLGAAITGCDLVSKWDAATQSYYSHVPGIPDGRNFDLIVGEAYFVSVTEDSAFELIGLVPESLSFNLITTPTTNVNAISLPYGTDITTADELGQSIGVCDLVSKWDAATQSYYSHVPGVPDGRNFDVYPGEAYFVSVTDDVVWP